MVGRGAHAALVRAPRRARRRPSGSPRRRCRAGRARRPVQQRARLALRVAKCSTPSQMFGRSNPRMTTSGSRRRRSSSDLRADGRRGGRGQRQQDRVAERLAHVAQPQVVRAEVVAPLRDAVGLVDDEEGGPRLAEALHRLLAWPAARAPAGRTRGRRRPAPANAMSRVVVAHGRVDRGAVQAPVARLLDRLELVLLQRDERRDDDGRPVEERAPRAGRSPTCPTPVDMTASVSRPATTASTASRCPGRSDGKPRCSRARRLEVPRRPPRTPPTL